MTQQKELLPTFNPKIGEQAQTTATIRNIRFTSSDGTFCILDATTRKHYKFTMVGPLAAYKIDDEIRVSGTWEDSKYGIQLRVNSAELVIPTTNFGLISYLASHIHGIGLRMAERIVTHFGEETVDVLDYHPEKLIEIKGISPNKLEQISTEWQENRASHQAFVYLQGHGLTYEMAAKLIAHYKERTIPVLQQQPYLLAKDIHGIGFRRADEIARRMGFPMDSPIRIEAGIDYALYDAEQNDGHCYLPIGKLMDNAAELLQLPRETLAPYMDDLTKKHTLRTEIDAQGEMIVYRAHMWRLENAVANEIARMVKASDHSADNTAALSRIQRIEAELGIELSTTQRKAVQLALTEKFMVITGGPGTGKTTLVKVFVAAAHEEERDVFLAAPTGRAAKRLEETTGHEAKTIHRLLEYGYREDARGSFSRNKDNPLPTGTFIIDESSMIDLSLMRSLLCAIPDTAQIVFVGDVDQLPSVGCGVVLKDLIDSNALPVVRLDTVFRQAEQSLIVKNAHRINHGEYPIVPSREEMAEAKCEFFFINPRPENTESIIERLVCEKIPERFHLDPKSDIQVLCPMRQNLGGVEHINQILQNRINPDGARIPFKNADFRVGDRVMQLKNDYDRDVFNGDIGTIIGADEKTTRIDFDGKIVDYSKAKNDFDNLALAYACTVHKSQGSEYPAVICVFLKSQSFMLQRNLIYTALTRARKIAIFITDPFTLTRAIQNDEPARRYTQLARRIAAALAES